MHNQVGDYLQYIEALQDIGIALSSEKDRGQLLERILSSAMKLTHADGGTLYLVSTDQKALNFEIFINTSLNMHSQRVSAKDTPFKPLPLYDNDGEPNLKNIATSCVLLDKTINIANAYKANHFDFSGTRKADQQLGYHSQSFLVVPLRNHEHKIIGVLQLINCIDPSSGKVTTFSKENERLAESLASQAAIILTQQMLIDAQKQLFEAFIKLIAKAIDEKSAYTSNHCTRVPILTMMLAEGAQQATEGPFKDFHLSDNQLEELRIAAWLHDCGKVSIPEYVMDKAKKLSGLSDHIEAIILRFEIIRRDLEIARLQQALAKSHIKLNHDKDFQAQMDQLTADQQFLERINTGAEFLADTDKQRITDIAQKYSYIPNQGAKTALLDEQDIVNLSVSRGTLNDAERAVIRNHVRITQQMLESLPYPEHLKHIPEIAGSHHERMDGTGYPRGLKGSEMLIQARMVAIADVFEALTAADRPYKPAKTLKETIEIMTKMKEDNHLDPDLFDLFVKDKIYLKYAKQYLRPEQLDLP